MSKNLPNKLSLKSPPNNNCKKNIQTITSKNIRKFSQKMLKKSRKKFTVEKPLIKGTDEQLFGIQEAPIIKGSEF